MKKRLYISNDEAGFFDNNKMLCLDNPPTQGNFIVGDIVISNKQENGVFGWVCVLAGSPGRWEVINDLRPIQEAIEQIEQRQETIVNGDLSTIKKQITQMAEQALILDKEHKDELSKITEKVSKNTTNILNINTELDNIKQTAGNLQGSVDQVVAGINAQVQTNKNNIQINSERITVLEGKQVVNEKEIQDIKIINDQQTADIKGACDKIFKIEQDIVKIEQAGEEIGELPTQVATNTENITDMNERLEIVEKDLEDAKVKVNEVETGMKDNCKKIDDIKKGIISALVSSGINANENMSWEELFGSLLQGSSVKPEEPNDPIEIIINEITIKVGETYDATKLYNLQEGYNVQYKYTAIISIEGEHTIVGKEVGTTNLEIICGEIIKNVKVNVEASEEEPEEIPCTSIRFTESILKIHIDQVTDLKEILVIQPDGCTDPVEWVADNTILEINNGIIKGLIEGSTKVQARCGDLSANITITVVPKTTEDLGEGILLYKAGTQYNDTEFRNLCLPNAENSLTSNAICYALHDYSHVWFSYDGYINFNDYDRIEITAYTENSQQQPMIGLGITSVSGQQGYQSSSEWEGTPHGNVVLMYNVTETKYTIPINYTGPGYLLLWMHRNNSGLGRVYITEIRVIPKKTDEPIEIIDDEITIQVGETYDATKLYTLQEGYSVQYKYSSILDIEGEHTIVGKEVGTTELEIICGGIIKTVTINVVNPTGGMVLFDNGEHFSTEFGDVVYPTDYVSHIGDIDFDLASNYCTYAAICYNGHINFNNYDAVAITVHTENTQQTNTQIMVGRGLDPVYMVAAGTPPYTMSYEESTFSTMTNTKTQATYTFSFDALRQQDDDTGYLGIRILRGDADGHVYIDKIVVYRDGEYNSGGTVEPR